MKKTGTSSPEHAAFTAMVQRIIAVPKEEIARREIAYQDQSGKNPRRRGPKRKISVYVADRDPAGKKCD